MSAARAIAASTAAMMETTTQATTSVPFRCVTTMGAGDRATRAFLLAIVAPRRAACRDAMASVAAALSAAAASTSPKPASTL